jgi:hypothetical protein
MEKGKTISSSDHISLDRTHNFITWKSEQYLTQIMYDVSQARFGHPGAFEAALQKLRGKATDISDEATEIKVWSA